MQFEDLPFAAFIDCQATEQRRFQTHVWVWKQVVVRSSVTPWRDGASHRLAFDSRKWTNRFSVKDMLNFFVASM
ncbi:hypothetical protein ABEO92_03550 [Geobacillus stearothermophilus]|jgi:hypothetical protein|uniref:hypothetical protein n=1 Tax=Geobacillus stearothermophilus TaxID=1422 RepID=UPI003D1D82CE